MTRVVVIVDLAGSTSYRIDHGDDAADRMLMQFEQTFERTVTDFDGRVVANHGDGFLASFASATNALGAIVSFRHALRQLPVDPGVPPLRAGVAAGDVIERGREMYGLPVVVAARLESLASPDEILCTDVVRALAGSRSPVGFEHERSLTLKGLPDDVTAWTVDARELIEESLIGSAAAARRSMPTAPDRFFGRTRELKEIDGLLRSHSLVTLLGPGGVGKTRLSLELADRAHDRFPDGAWFVPLEQAVVVEEVVATIGRTMRLPSAVLDGTPERLAAALEGVEALLVLDNCEQAVAPIGAVVTRLLSRGSRLAILCSSRESLTVPGETVWPLQPLDYPGDGALVEDLSANESVELFVDRVRTIDASRSFATEDLRRIGEIVRRLEGLPLAIELAASRLNVLSPEDMASRVSDLFAVLAQRDGFRPDRHSAIEATLEWSVSLLDDLERSVLFGVAVFVGGASLEAVERVCPDVDRPVLDVLSSLVNKSLLRRVGDRFVMLGSIREPVLVRSDAQERIVAARAAMVDYYEELAEAAGATVQPTPEWLARFRDDRENFANALAVAASLDKSRALRMTGQLALSWVLSGQSNAGDRIFTAVLNAPGDVEPSVRAHALRGAAMAAGLGGRYERSAELTAEARTIFTDLARSAAVAYCDYWLARDIVVQCHLGLLEPDTLPHAYRSLTESIDAFREEGDLLGELLAYPYLGWAKLLQGDTDAAEEHTRQMIDVAEGLGMSLVTTYATAHAAFIRSSIGALEQAAMDMKVALAGLEDTGDTQNLVIVSCVNTAVQLRLESADATPAARAMISYALDCDASEWEAPVLALGAHVAATQGHWPAAGRLISFLDSAYPTWRTALRNTGVDPGAVLEHVGGSPEAEASMLNYPGALRLLRQVLEGG